MNTIDLIFSDLKASKIEITQYNYLKLFFAILISRTVRVIICVRLRRTRIKLLNFIARSYLRSFFIEIGDNVQIGARLRLPHPYGIIIAGESVIGDDVQINQFVTIGGNQNKILKRNENFFQKLPIIGSRVVICPGAVIGGPVIIGDDVIIGANSVVTKDIPSNSMVYGQNILAEKRIKVLPSEGTFIEI